MSWRAMATFGLVAFAAALVSAPASAAPTPVVSKLQLRGHLPELGDAPSLRAFQTVAAYDTFRSGLAEANVFPPATNLFMSFDREILALYARGNDIGGRCLRTGANATLDADIITLDLSWEAGTCGAPATAHNPFILLSLSRTAADGSAWIQANRMVCGAPPGVDPRACATLGSGPAPSPSASPQPTAATASASSSPTATPAPSTARPSTPSPVVFASPTATASAVAVSTTQPVPQSDGGPNVLLALALVAAGILVGVALMAPRRPTPRR